MKHGNREALVWAEGGGGGGSHKKKRFVCLVSWVFVYLCAYSALSRTLWGNKTRICLFVCERLLPFQRKRKGRRAFWLVEIFIKKI